MATTTITARIDRRRVVVAVATAAAALLAFTNAAGTVFARREPARALHVAPGHPVALNTAAARLLADGQPARARALAWRSLAAAPLNPYALELAGFGGADAAWFAMSAAQSRRYLGAQLWLGQAAVARGDVADALRHHDVALRSSVNAPPLVLPLLVRASADPRLAAPLVEAIQARPRWLGAFVRAAVPDTARPDLLARAIVAAGGLPQTEEYGAPQVALAGRLLEAGDFAGVRALHRARGGEADAEGALAITPATTAPAGLPVSWLPMQRDDLRAEIGEGAIRVDVAPWTRGVAARKLLFIAPGRYRLTGRSEREDVATSWRVLCLTGRTSRALAAGADDADALDVTVPAGCGALYVDWMVAARERRGRARLLAVRLAAQP